MTIINPPAGYVDILGPMPEGVDFVHKLPGEGQKMMANNFWGGRGT
jgi:hypothetical protein